MYRKRGKAGVSAVVGGAIVLAIFFIIIMPLLILVQNSYAAFLHESNLRRILDTNRISESLSVKLSQNKTRELILIILNDGPITVRVVRIWALDAIKQTSITGESPCMRESDIINQVRKSSQNNLHPGRNITLNIQRCIKDFTGIAQFLVITERGRVFSSAKVNLTQGYLVDMVFPYTLTVSIMNMKRGSTYKVKVEPLNEGKVTPEVFTHKATASNENVTVAFGVTAGKYRVSLYENDEPAKIKENSYVVNVPDVTAVIFDLGRIDYQPVPLEVFFDVPRKVFVPHTDEESFVVDVWVQLPQQALEPVEIESVDVRKIKPSGPSGVIGDIICSHYAGFILQPKQRAIAAACTITVKGVGSPGSKYTLTIVIESGAIEGKGFHSSLLYKNDKVESPDITIQVRSKDQKSY